MIWTILYTFLEFANIFFAYRLLLGMSVTKRKTVYVLVLVLTSLMQIGAYIQWGTEWRDTLIILCGWIAMVILVSERRWKAFLLYPIVMFLISVINILGAYALATIVNVSMDIFVENGALLCMAECTGILVLGIYSIIIKGRNKEEVGLTPGQYVVLLVGVAGMFSVVAFSQALLFGSEVDPDIKLVVANVAAIAALLFVGLSFWNCASWKKAYRYRTENEMYAFFMEEQEARIRSLIVADEKRRRLNHDMSAHMRAIGSMAEKGQLTELNEYISSMKEKSGEEQESCFTSIVALDAVIDQCKQVAQEQGVSLTWSGQIAKQDKVSVFDLCTLFYNLLSNAVEAAAQTEKKEIQTKINMHQEMLVINMKNSCREDVKSTDINRSRKEDTLYHGLGHKNVEEIVHKHAGSITYEVNEGVFEVTVVI